MKSKPFIIVGALLLVCAIVLGGLYISGTSGTVRFDKQLQLGNKYLLEANYEQAILTFEKAINVEPKSVDARLGLAKAYIAVDRTDDAVAVLEDAMDIDPKRPEPYINLAKIYIDRGELGKTIEILEAGMKNSGESSIAALLDEIKSKAPVEQTPSPSVLPSPLSTIEPTSPTIEPILEPTPNSYYLENMIPSSSDRYTGNMGDSFIEKIGTRNGYQDSTGISYQYGLEIWIARWNFEDEISWVWNEYNIARSYKQLTATLTLLAGSYNSQDFDTTIEILGDDTVLFSQTLSPGFEPIEIDIDISGVSILKISAHDNIAKSGGTSFLLANVCLIPRFY